MFGLKGNVFVAFHVFLVGERKLSRRGDRKLKTPRSLARRAVASRFWLLRALEHKKFGCFQRAGGLGGSIPACRLTATTFGVELSP